LRRFVLQVSVLGFLALFNLGAWIAAFAAFGSHPALLGTALLAYTFGLRHAVDADHICAIDNVTRKLLADGQRPAAVGLFFSLGHSTVVIALSAAAALAGSAVRTAFPLLQHAGGVIGTLVSSSFLIAIAAVNAFVLADVVRAMRRARRGEPLTDQTLAGLLSNQGFLARFLRPLLQAVSKSQHMYAVGLLFGLGFDTATEVAVLGIAAIEGARGMPIFYVLLFPLLFTAGMSLLDTADGLLMLRAYGWALYKPERRLCYNLTVTLVSVLAAAFVGAGEALGTLHNPGTVGPILICVFAGSWGLAALVYRVTRDRRKGATIKPA
jgi:high-affinity nickel-transport protein